jgi:hypothetical protein
VPSSNRIQRATYFGSHREWQLFVSVDVEKGIKCVPQFFKC